MCQFMRILLSLFLMMFSAIGLAETSSVAPKIDENGRLILPNSVPARKLPTEIDPFFKKHKAYEYGATLHIQETDVVADKTKGYTLSSQRAYNEIASVLGHTPKWGDWAGKIKERTDSGVGSIEIFGQLTTGGIQVKGDYLGHAAFYTISNDSHENAKKNAFSAILPEIKTRNHFINQMENMGNLSPKERARLVHAYDYFHAQAQPNEYRAPYVFNPDYRKYAMDGEYWGREVKHTVCSRYAYYVSGSHKICRSSPMSVSELVQRGFNRTSQNLANHFDEVWQETNRKARQNLEQTGVDAPQGLNFVGWGSYHVNAFVGALTTVPDLAIRTVGADKAAGYIYDKYAPDDTKAIVSDMATSYANFAESNPNTNEITQLGMNFIPTMKQVKTFLPKKAGRGHDDFAGAARDMSLVDGEMAGGNKKPKKADKHNIPLTEEYFKQQYGARNVVQGGGKRLKNLERFDENQQINQKSNLKSYANSDNVLRIEHNAKLTTTVDGNLSVTHGLGYDAKKELDGIRAFLVENKANPNQVSYINSRRGEPDEISIATATVTTKDGKTINYLAVSGKSWSGNAPDKVTINGKEYHVLRNEAYNGSEKVLPDRFNSNNNQYNGNHAEKKIMSHITQQNQNGANIDSIKLNIQNTSDEFKGACYGCGGKDGTGGTIQDFKNLNKDLKIHIEHGSTGTKP